jgi:hypothetical protein
MTRGGIVKVASTACGSGPVSGKDMAVFLRSPAGPGVLV